jgi:hypothetical protein
MVPVSAAKNISDSRGWSNRAVSAAMARCLVCIFHCMRHMEETWKVPVQRIPCVCPCPHRPFALRHFSRCSTVHSQSIVPCQSNLTLDQRLLPPYSHHIPTLSISPPLDSSSQHSTAATLPVTVARVPLFQSPSSCGGPRWPRSYSSPSVLRPGHGRQRWKRDSASRPCLNGKTLVRRE